METGPTARKGDVEGHSLPGSGEHVVRIDQRVLFAVPIDRGRAVAIAATAGLQFDAADEIVTFGSDGTLAFGDEMASYLQAAASGLHIWEGTLDNRGFWFESDMGMRPIMLWRGSARVARLDDVAGFTGVVRCPPRPDEASG